MRSASAAWAPGRSNLKHVDALVNHWQREDLSVGTIKNRLATLRWWAEKVDRQNVIARSNAHYGVPDRVFDSGVSKAKVADVTDLAQINDPHVRMSLELQQAFGLRREEAIKFSPSFADGGDHVTVEGQLDQGRQGTGDSASYRCATRGTRPCPPTRRSRLVDPAAPQLSTTTAYLRTSNECGGSVEAAWLAACLRPSAIRGIDRLQGAGGRRSCACGFDADPARRGSARREW